MDFEKIKEASKGYLPQMTKFLRDLIAIPGESCGEELVIKRIEQEMNAVGFDKVVIDPMGNILGYTVFKSSGLLWRGPFRSSSGI